ncbi:Protein ALTERED PHOSPHATE STARVATION RESPONSE 1 [Linum perenne]
MGCVASKLEEEEEVVSICKERKRQLKQAVERRQALAEAHCRYCQSLYAVSAAIKLFVARHSSAASTFLITLPPHSPSPQPNEEGKNLINNNPMFLEEKVSDSTTTTNDDNNNNNIACESCDSSTTSSDSSEEEECKEETVMQHQHQQQQHQHNNYAYYYMQMPPQTVVPQSPSQDFGWDFFNPFDGMRPEVMSGYRRSLEDDLRAVREQEGIPELEEEEVSRGNEQEQRVFVSNEGKEREGVDNGGVVKSVDGNGNGNGGSVEEKGHSVMESPEKGRELLDALKDIEDHFVKAYDSGKDVSRMLEANKVYLQTGQEELKENANKTILALPWHRSTSFKPSSCKSLVASSSRSTSTWTEYTNDLFDGCGGMNSGSHSSTLGRLYAWEKKLYEEVKAGDATRKLYEKKCSKLRNHDVRGVDELNMDKTRASLKDLYARILVAIRSAESISNRIEKLRDEELQPQIVELLKGLTRTWKTMLECHETQNKILSQVKSFACPSAGKFCNDSHRLATLQLEAELLNWRMCFTDYVTASKAYVASLLCWLTKFLVPEVEFYSKARNRSLNSSSVSSLSQSGPPLLLICRNWLSSMENLPETQVSFALKSFAKDVRALWVQQGEEQKQKRKVESLAKELDKKTLSFQKTETRLLETKLIEYNTKLGFEESENPFEQLAERKDELDLLQMKLEMERTKHHNHMQETSRITLSGFQTGFLSVFESLIQFSKASMNMYNDLVVVNNNQSSSEKLESQPFVESSQVEENGGSR